MVGRDYLLGSVNEGFTYERGDDWRDEALCAQTDPAAFYPEPGGNPLPARAVCNGDRDNAPCPVRAECLTDALRRNERYGVWGGLTERQRRQLRPA